MIGGFRSDLSITCMIEGNFEAFPRVFCFGKSRINENGGNLFHMLTHFPPTNYTGAVFLNYTLTLAKMGYLQEQLVAILDLLRGR